MGTLHASCIELKGQFYDWHRKFFREEAILHAQTDPQNHKFTERWAAYASGAAQMQAELSSFLSDTSCLTTDRQISFGQGPPAVAQAGMLFMKLSKAFEVLGGIQQPPASTDPEGSVVAHAEAVSRGETLVRDVAEEIFIGLTGHKVITTERIE